VFPNGQANRPAIYQPQTGKIRRVLENAASGLDVPANAGSIYDYRQ